MSMNIQIVAVRGKDEEVFDAMQTPSDITRLIRYSHNKRKAYADWVKDKVSDQSGKYCMEYDPMFDHLKSFEKWYDEMIIQGYTIKFDVV